jgi:hypothetical protein
VGDGATYVSDAQLVRLAQSGDARQAETELCTRFLPRIRVFLARHLSGIFEIDDIAHDVVIGLLRAVREERVREPEHVGAFALGICRNKVKEVVNDMGSHYISALEEYCHDQAGLFSEDSNRWLFIRFLDELTTGYLAYRPITGELYDRDEILEHTFWVFGVMEDTAFYAPFSCRDENVSLEKRVRMKIWIRNAVSFRVNAENASDVMEYFHCKTLAAISFGKDEKGEDIKVLYWHPYFTSRTAMGLLRESVRFDDEE